MPPVIERQRTDVPLAALLSHAIGAAGPDAAAVAAIVLTIGAVSSQSMGAGRRLPGTAGASCPAMAAAPLM